MLYFSAFNSSATYLKKKEIFSPRRNQNLSPFFNMPKVGHKNKTAKKNETVFGEKKLKQILETEYYTAVKMNYQPLDSTARINLINVMLNEGKQRVQPIKFHLFKVQKQEKVI